MGQQGDGHSTDVMASPAPASAVPRPLEVGPRAAVDVGPRRLFDSHLPFVWRNLRRLGVPESLVEDAAQDVFLVVHRRFDSWQAERSTIESWLFGIVLRVAHDHRRAQKRRLAWLLPAHGRGVKDSPSPADGPDEHLARREAAALFEQALATLAADQRPLLLMIDVEQMTVPQAASALGINVNTAYWRLRKVRMAFRRALARLRPDDERGHSRSRP